MEHAEPTNVLLARFPERRPARRAMAVAEAHGADRVELVPRPSHNWRFHGRRLKWGALGAVGGALLGGLLVGALAAALDLEHGLIGSPFGEVIVAALFGALMGGTYGVISGFAVSEPAAARGVADHAAAHDVIPGEAMLRVYLPSEAREAELRAALLDAGARSVSELSHSPWPAAPVVEQA